MSENIYICECGHTGKQHDTMSTKKKYCYRCLCNHYEAVTVTNTGTRETIDLKTSLVIAIMSKEQLELIQ